MNETHLNQTDLEDYIIGALGPAQTAALEAHVDQCAVCAARLWAEARLEVALWQIGGALRDMPVPAEHHEVPFRPPARQGRERSVPQPARLFGRGQMLAAGVVSACAAAFLVSLLPGVLRGPDAPPVVTQQRTAPPVEQVREPTYQAAAWWMQDCPEQMSLRECRNAARQAGLRPAQGYGPGSGYLINHTPGLAGPGRSWQNLVHVPYREP